MKKYIIVCLLVVSFIITPVFVSAQAVDTIGQLLARIELLKQQIVILQNQQNQGGAWCHTFKANLGVGMFERVDSNEIIALQTALKRAGFNPNELGRYGEKTAAAVSGFQLKYKNEILTPLSVLYPTGYFGPATRQKMNSLYRCGNPVVVPSTIPATPNELHIDSITPSDGSIGTVLEIKGRNGFSGYGTVWMENSEGTSGVLLGNPNSDDSTIIETKPIPSRLCNHDEGGRGMPCSTWMEVSPGTYKIFVTGPNNLGQYSKSNSVNFIVTVP